MDGRFRLFTPPAQEPIDLDEVRDFCRIYHTQDDALLQNLMLAARQYTEDYADLALISQTCDVFLDTFPYGGLYPLRYTYGSPYAAIVPRYSYVFPSGEIWLPRGQIQSVTFLNYIADVTGTIATMDSSAYLLDNVELPARILPAYGTVWPTTQARPNAVQVRYVAGYGDDPSTVPEPIRLALKTLVQHWYEHREAFDTDDLKPVPLAYSNLLAEYRPYYVR